MRFAAPEEAADPNGLLLLAPKSIEVGPKYPLQSPGVLAITDKSLQLEA
jgi:hypothetical protein